MAEKFGMMYIDPESGRQWLWDGDGHYWYTKTTPEKKNHLFIKGERVHIHPDSLHLLEPQVGDLCVIENGHVERCDKIASDEEIGGKIRHVILLEGFYRLRSEVKGIIGRHDKAFMWPMTEGE